MLENEFYTVLRIDQKTRMRIAFIVLLFGMFSYTSVAQTYSSYPNQFFEPESCDNSIFEIDIYDHPCPIDPGEIQVTVTLNNSYIGDQVVYLVSPFGDVINLIKNIGYGGDDLSNTTFTDNAGINITAGSAPYSGSYRPHGTTGGAAICGYVANTSTFGSIGGGGNIDPQGVWTLIAYDDTQSNGGTLISWSITIPTGEPVAEAGANVSLCFGEETTLVASGGSTSATYTWSEGLGNGQSQTVSPTNTTTYTVEVIESPGCSSTDNVTVTVSPALNPNVTGTLSFCEGQSTVLNAGSGYNTYEWSNSSNLQTITVNTPGDYSVTVTDAFGCMGEDFVTVVENPLPIVDILGSLSFCSGESTTLDAGAGFDTYIWSNNYNNQTIDVSVPGNYSVTVTNASGCAASDNVTVIESSSLNPNISGLLSFCEGESTTLDVGTGFTNYNWSTSETTQSIDISTPGNYSVTVSDASGCTGTDQVTVVENPNPIVSISGELTYCAGGSTTLDAGNGFATYNWSTSETSQTIDVSATNTYTVTVTNNFGCTSTDNVSVTENNTSSASISGDLSFCQGESTVLDAGAGYATYAWSNSSNSQTINVTAPGNYSVTVTDASGCIGQDDVVVSQNALPTPNISGELSYCEGSSTTLNAGAYTSYAWSNAAISQTINVVAPGSYTVTVINVQGCEGVANVTVTENPAPTPNITGVLAYCEGASTTIQVAALYDTYFWSIGGVNNPSVNVDAPGTYSLTVTDALGCTGTDQVTVTENPSPNPLITGDFSFCEGNSTDLNAGSYTSYIWSTASVNQTITVSNPGTYSVTVTDNAGCVGYNQVNVTENPTPMPNILGNLSYCSGSSTTLSAGSYTAFNWSTSETTQTIDVSSPGTYSVTITDPSGCTGTDQVTVSEVIAPNPSISGELIFCSGSSTELSVGEGFLSYEWSSGENNSEIYVQSGGVYSVSVSNGTGCIGVATVDVTELEVVMSAIGSQTICSASPTELSTSVTGGVAPYTYYWDNEASSSSIIVSPEEPSNYSVYAVDAEGCVSNVSQVQLDIYDDVEVFVNTSTDDICQGASVNIVSDVQNGAQPYTLTLNGDHTISQSHTIIPMETSEYIVEVTDACGSFAQKQFSVEVHQIEEPVVATDTRHGCTDLPVSFEIENPNDSYEYWWDFGDNNAGIGISPSTTYEREGVYTVKLLVTNPIGCNAEFTLGYHMTVFDMPSAKFEVDRHSLSALEPIVTLKNTSEGASTYKWDFGDGEESTTAHPLQHVYNSFAPMQYDIKLVATSNSACVDSTYTTVYIEEAVTIYAPNAFTPNADGYNESFRVKGSGVVSDNFEFFVYDRWGEKIFETHKFIESANQSEGWDGKVNGNFVKPGIYSWLVRYQDVYGVQHEKSGALSLIR
jgi:gliding motility-associated-like protein